MKLWVLSKESQVVQNLSAVHTWWWFFLLHCDPERRWFVPHRSSDSVHWPPPCFPHCTPSSDLWWPHLESCLVAHPPLACLFKKQNQKLVSFTSTGISTSSMLLYRVKHGYGKLAYNKFMLTAKSVLSPSSEFLNIK